MHTMLHNEWILTGTLDLQLSLQLKQSLMMHSRLQLGSIGSGTGRTELNLSLTPYLYSYYLSDQALSPITLLSGPTTARYGSVRRLLS